MPTLKLRGKIVGAAALVFVLAIASSLIFVVQSTQNTAIIEADRFLGTMAQSQAKEIKNILEAHGAVASSVARTFTSLAQDPNVAPESYKRLFEEQLPALPHALGIWALINPGQAQAADPDLAVEHLSLPGGYFGPSYQRDLSSNVATFRKMNISMEGGLQGWYLDPLAADKPVLNGPYLYDGSLFTSSTDIVRDAQGKGVGLVGVDFNGGVFSELIGTAKPMGTGWVRVINQAGNWVVHPDPEMLGKPADEDALKSGVFGATTEGFLSTVALDGQNWRLSAVKAEIPGFDIAWTVLVGVPETTLFANAIEQRNVLIIGSLILLGLGLSAFWWLGSSITRPISKLTTTMDTLASGKLDVIVEGGDARDEIGAMARAVEVFQQNALKVVDMTQAEAARVVRDEASRKQMMSDLQASFGDVVDAATVGDFSKRVQTQFPDPELNGLAQSVNTLVETVDSGLSETSAVLAAIARAELDRKVTGDYKGAFGQLKTDTNAVAEKLTEIVSQLKTTSQQLKMATGEILSGANDLSERTTRQAATIEETSATMEQLAVTVVNNAKKAENSSLKAAAVSQSAQESGQVMAEANHAMERITTSSSKISNIIGMIDDIAFQTNLLALNASVEAARAGDAGKGFAVVAVEVRRLAQSAAQASSEVKVLIEQSAGEVSVGTKLVAEASSKLADMLGAIRETSAEMDGVAGDSREQASSIEEVNVAVRQMDEMTQHNAALVEEINAAIEQTEAQAVELDKIVEVFKINASGQRQPIASPHSPPTQSKTGIRALQDKVRTAAKSYLSHGNAAVRQDWSEF